MVCIDWLCTSLHSYCNIRDGKRQSTSTCYNLHGWWPI